MPVNRQDQNGGKILVVDDAAELRDLISRFLARRGHRVDTAASAQEAMELLSAATYDLVLTDLQMPGESGLELLAELRSRSEDTRAILMSGAAAASDAAVAIEHGIDRLLLKPFELTELQAAVEKALAERRARTKGAQERELFEAMVRHRKTESQIWILRAARALVTAVEAKDSYTRGHAARVTSYTLVIANTMGGFDINSIRLAGDLHDVGKIGVPDAILNKPDKLTAEELDAVQKHPEIGWRILEPLIDDPVVIGVVRWHHERWDGAGYPDGLSGEEIPRAARILAVADTLDAMTSPRAYRTPIDWDVAVADIIGGAGERFDPEAIMAFEISLERLKSIYTSFPRDG
jgi:putative two-component system response regulator